MLYAKDPSETLDYTFDWDDAYLQSGETISTSAWAVTPSGPTLSGASNTNSTATTFMAGGTAGHSYRLTNTIVTSASRTAERSITVRVFDR